MTESSSDRDPVEVLAEEFAQRCRRGEKPTIDEYAEKHPALADRIRRLFPVLVVMEDVGEQQDAGAASVTAVAVPPTSAADGKASPLQLNFERTSQQAAEISRLVRRRYLAISLVTSIIFILVIPILLFDLSPAITRTQLGWAGFFWLTASLACAAAFFVVCWRQPRISLERLRRLEWLLLGVVGVTIAYVQWCIMSVTPADGFEGPRHAQSYLGMVNFGRVFEWFVLIVCYGLFIPNPWWRTALVAALFSAAAVAVVPLAALQSEVIRDNSLYLLGWTLFSVLPASAIAIVSSFKISSLQQEVFAARRLGPYQLKKQLGKGGMGEVYLAEHRLLKRPCAVKLIRADRAGDSQLLSRFEREVQVTSQLTHPNTIEIFDYGNAGDGVFYYAMEYLDGMDLEQLVRQHGLLPPARVVHFTRQLCGALQEAHSKGLVHRDIKPSNIIVCNQGGVDDVVKLLDFGLVGRVRANSNDTRLTQDGAAVGTPHFMSPEQARGDGNVDARSDLYSLGAVMYYLLTAKTPFEGESGLAVILAHVQQPVRRPSEHCSTIPNDMEAIIMRCLAKDPAQRFADALSLEGALAKCS